MHGLRAESVVVTGAQCYDQCFASQPSRSRAELCASLGLDPAPPVRPLRLFGDESCSGSARAALREGVGHRAVRASDDASLRDAGILIRPHPERVREWDGVTLDAIRTSRCSGAPIAGEAKADYFDSLYYSAAVIGLCTSAFSRRPFGPAGPDAAVARLSNPSGGDGHFRYL